MSLDRAQIYGVAVFPETNGDVNIFVLNNAVPSESSFVSRPRNECPSRMLTKQMTLPSSLRRSVRQLKTDVRMTTTDSAVIFIRKAH